jgi:aspartyl-tRNA(Asn)/glutamyl-tRNA(Gln) amidotransferase subunit C
MSVTREQVEGIARLAALALPNESIPGLTEQIGRILDYISQLEAVADAGPPSPLEYPGPHQPLRDDAPRATPPAIRLERIAPLFREGLFLVPRLGSLGPSEGAIEDPG